MIHHLKINVWTKLNNFLLFKDQIIILKNPWTRQKNRSDGLAL